MSQYSVVWIRCIVALEILLVIKNIYVLKLLWIKCASLCADVITLLVINRQVAPPWHWGTSRHCRDVLLKLAFKNTGDFTKNKIIIKVIYLNPYITNKHSSCILIIFLDKVTIKKISGDCEDITKLTNYLRLILYLIDWCSDCAWRLKRWA